MNQKIKEFLEKIGLSDEFVTALSSTEKADLDKVNVDEIVLAVNENYKKVLGADPAFIEPHKKAARGEVLSAKENKFMKLTGVTKEEYDALPDKTKFDSLIDLGLKKLSDSLKQPDDKKLEEIRKLTEALAGKDEEIRTIREKEIPEVENKYKAQMDDFHYRGILAKSLTKADEKDDFAMVVKMEGAIPGIDAYIKNNYGIKVVDGKSVTLLKKGEDLEAFENNKPIDFVKLARKAAKELGYVKESAAGETGKGGNGGDPAGDKNKDAKYDLPGMKKLDALSDQYKKKED